MESILRCICRNFLLPGCRLRGNRQAIALVLVCLAMLLILALASYHTDQHEDRAARLYTMSIHLPPSALPAQQPGAYLCTSISLQDANNSSATQPIYVVEFEPHLVSLATVGSHAVLHHMLLAECAELPDGAANSGWWNCGHSRETEADDEKSAPSNANKEMCSVGLRYLYAYSSYSPAFRLPQGIVMPVGDRKYYGGGHLVLQVHYSSLGRRASVQNEFRSRQVQRPSLPGVILGYQRSPAAHQSMAGVHLSAVSAKSIDGSVLTVGCEYTGRLPLQPFALRVHTHSLGRLVSVYRVRRPELPQQPLIWHLIGQANPRLPQAYYPTNSSAKGLTILPGDLIATVCSINSNKQPVSQPPIEMCNAWLVYKLLDQSDNLPAAGPDDANVGKVELRHLCVGAEGARIWSEAPDWVTKQAIDLS